MGHYLVQTIESVLSNLKPGDQYFIIDGGSTDGSLEIIKSYSDRLTGWISESDNGYADALNKGFSVAVGDMLCWVNSGDLLLPKALETARKVLEETDAEFIFGDDFNIDERNCVINLSRGRTRNLRRAMLYGGWTPLQDACFWRRSLYERVGGINADLKFAADYDLFLRMNGACDARYVPITFSAFRTHKGQKSIAGAKQYRAERERVREQEMSKIPTAQWKKTIVESLYYLVIRFRVHVLQKVWRLQDKRFIGTNVNKYACGKY
jgi:glycosyltransferase involved in cell wall biosynthesis